MAEDSLLSDAPNSNICSSHISFLCGVRASWFNARFLKVSCSNRGDVSDDIGISVSQTSPVDRVFPGIVSRSDQPEVVMKLSHQPGEIAHAARDVLIKIAAV